MMYGCDMPALRDIIKECAKKVHSDPKEAFNLRGFILEACCQANLGDGSYMHPAFQEGRVEICFSEVEAQKKHFITQAVMGQAKQSKACQFESTADAIIAMLASSTMGISGTPFTMRNAEGQRVRVADSAFTSFLPTVDEFSIKVKPFSDGLGIFAGACEVTPTEFVPSAFGLVPLSVGELDHLYELGYRDMDAWLETQLDARLQKIAKAQKDKGPDRAPVSFECTDMGNVWYTQVKRSVPINWPDMTKAAEDFDKMMSTAPLVEGEVSVEVGRVLGNSLSGIRGWFNQNRAAGISASGRMHCKVTRAELQWGSKDATTDDDAMKPLNSGIPEAPVQTELGKGSGKVHVAHILSTEVKGNKLKVTTCDRTVIKLLFPSTEEAKRWCKEIRLAQNEQHEAAQRHVAE
jgi:hypothetical protein